MTRKIALLMLAPALALGLTACGSSDDGPTAPSPSSSPSASMSMSDMPSPSSSQTAAPSTPATTDAEKAVISIADFTFKVPASVAPGATITIMNSDSQAHTVTSKEGGFDVKVDPNGTATLTAPSKPGSYPFVCTFHGNMTSTLVVK
ncbi:putative secreted metal-binding protein [Janibacter sp. HTCC2649]|uniref:cupredoxin domain-containing protein n=1 Tax=Janibacter sp. HTCC2649 TaxID=313589 RepID=UPI0000671A34|nr:cupredoxin domain-containing protein [Janibacter sp. HTCC2649]EAP98352.1 putative secreted metal-binding protein [Janibacter sp. HTCC2649]